MARSEDGNAARFLHALIGSPAPCDHRGDPIPARGAGGRCACCGEAGRYRVADALSDNFTTVKNDSRARPFGGQDLCMACMFAHRTLRLRVMSWFASAAGLEWVRTRPVPREDERPVEHAAAVRWWAPRCRHWPAPRPDALATLLAPPEPPFVACWSHMGVAKGGEIHGWRAWWPGEVEPEGGWVSRLQSKHILIYARVATSRTRYPLQVDDEHDTIVDVPLWSALRVEAESLLLELRAAGVGADDCRSALVTMRPPTRCPLGLVRDWRARTRLVSQHHAAHWWPLVVDLLPMPPLPEKPNAKTRTRADERPQDHHVGPSAPVLPAAGHHDPHPQGPDRGAQVRLPW